ncbi:hypothetical protein BGW38_008466 [Lunasporangiospora selenospora]|uniref:Protein UNC80 C-terminal domain-containing protein n=1 Tax=Lunasporangiospora selenospora TaxID=979761 RepID=A0A9P6FY01_9FUNG|nr:hypothetical protein BGW38_008466 [Lunasporangiospora selenospora]
MIMDRIRTGDLGFGFQKTTDRPKQERLAHVAFLRGLAECLRLRDQMSVRLLVQDFIPRYWMEPDSKYPMTMDGPVRVLGQAFSEFLLHAQVRCTDCTESVKSLLQNFLEFFEKKLPPTQLNGAYGKEAITTLIRCILLVFSIEFKEAPLVKSKQGGGIHEISKDGNGHLTSAPGPMDGTAEYTQRTPPGTPRSFGTRSDVFAQTQPPNPSSSQEQVMLQQEQGNPLLKVSRAYLMALWENGHQELIIDQLKIETEDLPLRRVINIYHRLILGSKLSMGSEILTATLNTLFSKLVAQLPGPNEALSELLRQLSIRHRAIFYKPMIACVASDSTQFVTDYLCILACLEMHMSLVDLYMRDVGLICVIVMTDVGPERPRVADASQNSLRWGSCTVGQCVIVLEFIYAIKRLARNHDNHQVEMGKMFLIDLEQRLGLYLSQKEKRILVPRPIRVLLCMILYEIRMLCKTIHRPIWLLRILSWAINHNLPIEAGSSQSGPSGISETMRLRIKHIYNNVDGLIVESKDKTPVHDLYPETILPRRRDSVATQVGSRPAVPVMSSISGFGRGQFSQPSRVGRMADIQLDEPAAVLALLITVHSTIQPNEYLRLSKPLWNIYCLESKPKISGAAAFLFVKCADVDPRSIQILILADLTSEDPYKRQSAIEKLDCLFEHRNSLLLQPFVTDPSSRGPFRTVNVQVPYALPEVGSNRYTMDEPRWLTILNSVGNFPSDIRDKFQELRWGERDKQEMEMIRRVQTPLILSWTGYLDEDYESKVNFGRTFTNPRDRHAMVMLPDLNALNLGTIDLLEDQSVGVRVAALNFLTNYIRNEPLLFVRTFFADMVRKTPERQKELIRRLHLLLSGSSKLPPAFAFALFNHLLGLLKWFQRNSKPKGFDMIEAVLPVLAEMVTSTNDIVFKDFKRNKVDVFFSPLGRFWFRPDIIPESMFPSYATMLVFGPLEIPHQTFQMAMINISQFQFMTNFIARFPLEVAEIQNSVGRFHMLPKLEQGLHPIIRTLGEDQYLPDMSKEKARFIKTISTKDRNFSSLSSLRARAWLCFVLNLIQRMRRSNTDQLELMNLFGGVNLILLEHGGDLGIVGQALDIYVLATTRLRRFFWSHNGYSLIFPALFKIYCDSSANQIVHETINASFYRFYQLHQESFVLQSLGSIAPLMLRKMEEEQLEIMTRHLLSFLEALDQPVTTRHSKALGVQSLAEPFFESSTNGGPQLEIPQWISSFIPRDSKLFQGNTLSKQDFSIADSIKLFLAVIAFDPGSVRSEQFVRIFRLLLPYFLERNPELTTGGLDSLIEVMSRFARSSKPLVSSSFVPPSFAPRVWKDRTELRGELSPYALVQDPLVKPKTIKGKTWAQNDRVAIKHEFLCLIQLFCERGGQLADSQHQHMATLIRSIMKDYSLLKIPTSTDWIKDYIQKVILPVENFYQSSRAALYLLGQISGPIRTYYKSVDYSGLINGLTLIVKDDRGFLRSSTELACMIRDRIVNSGLVVGTKDDWNGASPCSSQARFCSSLVNLILAMINNADLDTIAEIEQSTPTPRLMAYIVIPMCLRFKSRYRLNNLDILEMQFWLRMLGLTIKAAEYDPDSRKSSRSTGLLAPVLNVTRVHKKRSSMDANAAPLSPQFPPHQVPSIAAQLSSGQLPPQTPGHSRFSSIYRDDLQDQDQTIPAENTMNASPGLLIDFIALRIIIVRGERYLSFHPGCWLDVFNITKKHFSIHAFAASIFAGRSGHGSGLLSHANNNSGPASPIIATTPYPSTPRTEWPMTPGSPQRQANTSSLSPFPLFGRTSGDVTPIPGSITARSTVPTTALGYVLPFSSVHINASFTISSELGTSFSCVSLALSIDSTGWSIAQPVTPETTIWKAHYRPDSWGYPWQ